jgi:hypothetical protein
MVFMTYPEELPHVSHMKGYEYPSRINIRRPIEMFEYVNIYNAIHGF